MVGSQSVRAHRGRKDDRLDGWLRFSPAVQAHYLRDHYASRVEELRSAIIVGLILYNAYNFTDALLQPDILLIAMTLRIGVVTTLSLALVVVIRHTAPVWTERLVLIAVSNAYLLPLLLFYLSREPTSVLTFPEMGLTLVYANMLLGLRFRHAVAFTSFSLLVTLAVLLIKPDVTPAVQFAFMIQTVTASLFSLYANYRMERRRCLDYLGTLGASLRAESAEMAHQRSEGLSRTDALTGLANRRHLEEQLAQWVGQAQSLAVLMVDIDHFKLYNDALGHPAGDDCLKRVADVFTARCATPDIFCARLGGEEFTVVIKDAGEGKAIRLAELLLADIRARAITHPARDDHRGIVTFSIGVAHWPEIAGRTPRHVLEIADAALYAAKRRGRDGFAMAGDAPEAGASVA